MKNFSFLLTFLTCTSVALAIFLGYRIGYFMASQPKKPPRKRRPILKIINGGKQ